MITCDFCSEGSDRDEAIFCSIQAKTEIANINSQLVAKSQKPPKAAQKKIGIAKQLFKGLSKTAVSIKKTLSMANNSN